MDDLFPDWKKTETPEDRLKRLGLKGNVAWPEVKPTGKLHLSAEARKLEAERGGTVE